LPSVFIGSSSVITDGWPNFSQRAESKFIIHTVCDRIRRERPDAFVATIHDSVLVLPSDADFVVAVMKEEFAKIGLSPRLEIENL